MIDCFGEHYGWDQDRWQELHQWENLTIKFTLTYIDQHSQQDNRFFTQKGTQSFKELSREVEARYRHLGSIRLSFLMPTNEQITLDSEEVYEMILRESAKKARNKRELEVTLYVKKVDSGFAWDQNNSGWRGAGLPANSPIGSRRSPSGAVQRLSTDLLQRDSAGQVRVDRLQHLPVEKRQQKLLLTLMTLKVIRNFIADSRHSLDHLAQDPESGAAEPRGFLLTICRSYAFVWFSNFT